MKDTLKYIDYDTTKIPKCGKKLDTIFHENADVYKTAYLNWRMGFRDSSRSQFVVLGEAFFQRNLI